MTASLYTQPSYKLYVRYYYARKFLARHRIRIDWIDAAAWQKRVPYDWGAEYVRWLEELVARLRRTHAEPVDLSVRPEFSWVPRKRERRYRPVKGGESRKRGPLVAGRDRLAVFP